MLHPALDGEGREIELIGEIAAMVELGMAGAERPRPGLTGSDRGLFGRSVKLVAGIGFEPMTFRV